MCMYILQLLVDLRNCLNVVESRIRSPPVTARGRRACAAVVAGMLVTTFQVLSDWSLSVTCYLVGDAVANESVVKQCRLDPSLWLPPYNVALLASLIPGCGSRLSGERALFSLLIHFYPLAVAQTAGASEPSIADGLADSRRSGPPCNTSKVIGRAFLPSPCKISGCLLRGTRRRDRDCALRNSCLML
jgi:hypothetical protein